MGIGCSALEAVEADFGILGESSHSGSEHSLLNHMDLVYAKADKFDSAFEMELKE